MPNNLYLSLSINWQSVNYYLPITININLPQNMTATDSQI